MTEAEWLACDDPARMLRYCGERASDRKLRLFSCACCRRGMQFIEDVRLRDAIETIENIADRVRDRRKSKVGKVCQELANLSPNQRHSYFGWELWTASRSSKVLHRLIDRLGDSAARAFAPPAERKLLTKEKNKERKQQAMLLRHIIGNNFRPFPAPSPLPTTIIQLAESLYAGTDCAFALHDALLEAGQAELAEHFAREQWHPKGCWAVDLLFGKS